MKSRLFGRLAQRAFRTRNANDFNYGGSTHVPDPDVSPDAPEPAPVSSEAAAVPQADPAPSALFSSPLPDHAFETGDLNDDFEDIVVERAGAPRQARAMRPPRRPPLSRLKELFTRH